MKLAIVLIHFYITNPYYLGVKYRKQALNLVSQNLNRIKIAKYLSLFLHNINYYVEEKGIMYLYIKKN